MFNWFVRPHKDHFDLYSPLTNTCHQTHVPITSCTYICVGPGLNPRPRALTTLPPLLEKFKCRILTYTLNSEIVFFGGNQLGACMCLFKTDLWKLWRRSIRGHLVSLRKWCEKKMQNVWRVSNPHLVLSQHSTVSV